MLRGVIGAFCFVSLVVASACASETTDESTTHASARQAEDEVDFEIEAASQGELPHPPERTAPAEGWRWEGSLGIELAVPADWSVNDTGCLQTDAPTIVHGPGSGLDCFTPEAPTKQIVRISRASEAPKASPPDGLTARDVSIGSVPAQRAEGHTSDGRASGWLRIPQLDVVVTARVLEDETLRRVFDSVRVVEVDHNGCAASRADMRPTPPTADTFVPDASNALSICFVGQGNGLESSALIEGSDAVELVEQLNQAKRGMNGNVPESRCYRNGDEPLADVMVIAQGDSDRALVQVWFSGCTHRGMTNGRSTTQLTEPLLHAIMGPLHRGYGYQPFRTFK